MKQWDIMYEYHGNDGYFRVTPPKKTFMDRLNAMYVIEARTLLGMALLAIGLGGVFGPMIPNVRLEAGYMLSQTQETLRLRSGLTAQKPLPESAPVVFEPLTTPDGASIDPVNKEFSLIVPKIGINAPIVASVDPSKPAKYADALNRGIAHSATSFFPDEDGTVYLFSHSTNYDWFVKDLNAIFYLLKNVEVGDTAVIFYKEKQYTYKITGKKIVSPTSTAFLVPLAGKRSLILQTCWPPGSTTERLLIFADLIQDNGKQI
jgi:LPXTG-site transpeptidase (sortase) family protein